MNKNYVFKVINEDDILIDEFCGFGSNAISAFENCFDEGIVNVASKCTVLALNESGLIFSFEVGIA